VFQFIESKLVDDSEDKAVLVSQLVSLSPCACNICFTGVAGRLYVLVLIVLYWTRKSNLMP